MSVPGLIKPSPSKARVALFMFALAACCTVTARASASQEAVVCRHTLTEARRQEIASRLREITGWGELRFDEGGVLRLGGERHAGGSQTARALLELAARGDKFIVIEDASGSADVVFSRVVEGRWSKDAEKRPPAFVVQIDFADFARVTGDRDALASFNVGWAVLHEISHVVNDSVDTEREGEVGDCEALINQMRRECGLAERAEYHFHLLPDSERGDFKTRYVRLAFEQQDASGSKKRRLWIMWDAELVGGLEKLRRQPRQP